VIEILVGAALTSLILGVMGAFFVASRNFAQQEVLRVETTQALRSSMDNLTRDLRLSGACLPVTGNFVSLGGTNSGTLDAVVTRTGVLRSDLSCVRTTLSAAVLATTTTLPVVSANGFASGTRVYLRNPNGTGELFTLTGAQTSNNTLLKTGALSAGYPIGSGVYAVDERQYGIDTTNAALPVLTVALNGNAPMQFASGIESVNVQYELQRNCPPCDVVDLPQTDNEWAMVKQLFVNITARSRVPGWGGQYIRLSGQIGVKPRNLVPK